MIKEIVLCLLPAILSGCKTRSRPSEAATDGGNRIEFPVSLPTNSPVEAFIQWTENEMTVRGISQRNHFRVVITRDELRSALMLIDTLGNGNGQKTHWDITEPFVGRFYNGGYRNAGRYRALVPKQKAVIDFLQANRGVFFQQGERTDNDYSLITDDVTAVSFDGRDNRPGLSVFDLNGREVRYHENNFFADPPADGLGRMYIDERWQYEVPSSLDAFYQQERNAAP